MGGTHPTGMHSCLKGVSFPSKDCFILKFLCSILLSFTKVSVLILVYGVSFFLLVFDERVSFLNSLTWCMSMKSASFELIECVISNGVIVAIN